MKKVEYAKLNKFISSNVVKPFYEKRSEKLKTAKVSAILERKNPYLFKTKNIETAGDLAKNILDAFLSSQEETIFGNLMERLAIQVCHEVFGGKKAEEGKYKSVDLIFNRDKKIYVVGIKSGPNWGNADQVSALGENLKAAQKMLKKESKKEIILVNGCIYGRDTKPHKTKKKNSSSFEYHKLCGQSFWELISGDEQLYKRIIQPLSKETKKRDEVFKSLYVNKVNEMTKYIVDSFYTKNMLDWDKIIEYVSKR